jgi:hypothetical protein
MIECATNPKRAGHHQPQTLDENTEDVKPLPKEISDQPAPADAMRIATFTAKHDIVTARWLRESPEVTRWKIANRILVSESQVLGLAAYSPARATPAPSVEPPEATEPCAAPPVPATDVRAVITEGLGLYLEDVPRELVNA